MARHKDVNWNVGEKADWEGAQLSVLMDLRDELKRIRQLMECPNIRAGFIAMASLERHVRRRFPIRKRVKK